jgi:signal transduction histidine kinase
MLRLYTTIVQLHDARFVVLAIMVCLLASYTAFTMMARLYAHRSRYPWVIAAAVVTGCGAWATHSIVMLAFQPGVPVAYDVGLTVISGLIAVTGCGLGFYVARGTERMALGGSIVGFAIGAMHFSGVAAVTFQAQVQSDIMYFEAAVIAGASFGAAALARAQLTPDVRGRIVGAILLTAGIFATHFIAMAGRTFVPDPSIVSPEDTLVIVWFAIALTAVVLLIIGLGIVGTLVDQHLQEIEAAKGELEAALVLADAASKSKTKFLSTMSHELRSPLNVIIGSSERLKEEAVTARNEQYRESIDRILDSGVHLMRLVNSILDISEFDAGQLRLNDEFLDVGQCVGSALQLIEQEAQKAGVRLSAAVDPDLPKLCGDAKRINQILINLISNGIRFSPHGGEVRVSAFRRDDGLSLSVADSGIGIPANDIPKALERFGQLDTDPNRQHEGAGLGLPLAQHLMEMHGGTLRISSEPGVGTTVTVTFPARRIVRDRSSIRMA